MESPARTVTVCGALLVLVGLSMWLASSGDGGVLGRGTGEGSTVGTQGQSEPGAYLPLEDLRKTADLGVHGTVRSVRGVLVDETPFQEVVVAVEKTLLGASAGQVTVMVYGGEADGMVSHLQGAPGFTPGQEVVLFLRSWRDVYVITGIQQGLFRVVEEDGRKVAVRDFTWVDIIGDNAGVSGGYERLPLETVLGEAPKETAPAPEPRPAPEPPKVQKPPAVPVIVPSPSSTRTTRAPSEPATGSQWALILIAVGVLAVVGSLLFKGKGGRPAGFTTWKLLAFVVAAWLVLAVLSDLSVAYTPIRSSTGTVEVRWILTSATNPRIDAVNRMVRYAIHAAGSDNVADDSEKTAIAAAATAWSGRALCQFRWTRLADDTRPISSQTSSDNVNSVYWLETTTVDPHGFDMAGALARTPFRFFTTGELIDADVSFNGVNFTWSTILAAGTQDVGSVAAHELGHALGLEHSAHQAATMKPTAPNFDRRAARTLTADDVIGVQRRYPLATFATQRGRISGTIRTASGVNVHAAIVLARHVPSGVVSAAVLSTRGNYLIEGLAAGTYVVQTQALGRSISDEASRYGTFLATGATTAVKSVATDDRQASVTAGVTTTVPLVMSDGGISTKIDFIVTRMPGSSTTRASNGPVLLARGLTGVLVGFIGQGMPTSASQVAGVDFGTTQVTVASGPFFNSGFSNSVHWFVNISSTAAVGPRNIEMRLTNGTRIICVGGLEIQ